MSHKKKLRLFGIEEQDLLPAELKERGDLSQFAENVMRVAGERLLNYVGRIRSAPKGHFDLVTTADTEVEAFIVAQLRGRFPEDQILAEESPGPGTGAIEEFCWVIDPLDGTVNFAMGIPLFSVSLALLHRGDPILGWVYDPVREELFRAQRGAGSFLNNHRLAVASDNSSPVPLGGSSGFLAWATQAGPASPLLPMMRQFGKLRILGSQALHLCYVAAGRLRAAISWEARLWDDAAGALIAREAGARYTDFWGRDVFPLRASSPALAGEPIHSLAAPSLIHGELLTLLAKMPSKAVEPMGEGSAH